MSVLTIDTLDISLWLPDSGVFSHITNNYKLFDDYDPYKSTEIVMIGDG